MFDSKKLRKRRLELNLRQEDIYQILAVPRSLYAKWESGAQIPTYQQVLQLSKILSVEDTYLIDPKDIFNIYLKLSTKNKKKVVEFAYHLYRQQ